MPPRPAGRRRAPWKRPSPRGRPFGLTVEILEDRILRSDATGLGSTAGTVVAGHPERIAHVVEAGETSTAVPQIGKAQIVASPWARAVSREGRAAAFGWLVNYVGYDKNTNSPAVVMTPSTTLSTEMAAPHPEPEQAQPLIGSGTWLLDGVMGPGDRSDFYRVESDSGGVRIGLKTTDPDSPMADRLVIVDESGRLVGDWTLPGDSDEMTVELTGTEDELGHELFIGIGPGQGAGHNSLAERYLLRVEPLNRSGAGGSGSSATATDLLADFAQGGTINPPGTTAPVTTPTGALLEVSVAGSFVAAGRGSFTQGLNGPLPMLSATPFGGALMLQGPVESSPADGVLLDLALAGVFLDPQVAPSPDGTDPVGPIVDHREDQALPVLVAAHARLETAGPAVPTDLLAVADPGSAAHCTSADGSEPTPRRGGGRHALLPLGLGLLATLATTMTLEDPRVRQTLGRRRRRLPAWLREWLGLSDPDA